ncbi:EF-hand domain-containing protein [Fulvimonas yonginensis]|uniref:EF-hand domain-containing protein n=1 Tax=Fulvimonas yonginensis TaxID=1495200 RepID=A0ABU8JBR3_9GAMM
MAADRLAALALLLPLAVLAQDTPADYLRRFDTDGDGRIDVQEYVNYLSAGFRAMDANGDGVLDATELPPGPRRTPRTLAAFQADLRAQFHRLDRNRDGYLSARELAQPPG